MPRYLAKATSICGGACRSGGRSLCATTFDVCRRKCAAIDDDEYAFQLVEAMEDSECSGRRARRARCKNREERFWKSVEIAKISNIRTKFLRLGVHHAATATKKPRSNARKIQFLTQSRCAAKTYALFTAKKEASKRSGFSKKLPPRRARRICRRANSRVRNIANHFAEAKETGKRSKISIKKDACRRARQHSSRRVSRGIAQGFCAGSVDLATARSISSRTKRR